MNILFLQSGRLRKNTLPPALILPLALVSCASAPSAPPDWAARGVEAAYPQAAETDAFTAGRWIVSNDVLTIKRETVDGMVPYNKTVTAKLTIVDNDTLSLLYDDGKAERLARNKNVY